MEVAEDIRDANITSSKIFKFASISLLGGGVVALASGMVSVAVLCSAAFCFCFYKAKTIPTEITQVDYQPEKTMRSLDLAVPVTL